MTTRTTLSPVEATTKAVDALLTALASNPSPGAAAAYRSALVRHGRHLLIEAGPGALDAVLVRVEGIYRDRGRAQQPAAIVAMVWLSIPEWQDEAWFQANPSREYRCRHQTAGEKGPDLKAMSGPAYGLCAVRRRDGKVIPYWSSNPDLHVYETDDDAIAMNAEMFDSEASAA